jgi:hypothetical protein
MSDCIALKTGDQAGTNDSLNMAHRGLVHNNSVLVVGLNMGYRYLER